MNKITIHKKATGRSLPETQMIFALHRGRMVLEKMKVENRKPVIRKLWVEGLTPAA